MPAAAACIRTEPAMAMLIRGVCGMVGERSMAVRYWAGRVRQEYQAAAAWRRPA